MAGKYIKGAFVEFMQTFLVPLPNVIVFQYNPETITHTLTQSRPAPAMPAAGKAPISTGEDKSNPFGVKGAPGESFSFTIKMDAGDMIADGSPIAEGIAKATGISTYLAALEMLLYPVSDSNAASLFGSFSSPGNKKNSDIPKWQLPTVLFVWGPGCIWPIRLTSLTITDQLYDSLLFPTHAEAQISLSVLTKEELEAIPKKDWLRNIAIGAYNYSLGLRQTLAVANLANAAESVIGMLPL